MGRRRRNNGIVDSIIKLLVEIVKLVAGLLGFIIYGVVQQSINLAQKRSAEKQTEKWVKQNELKKEKQKQIAQEKEKKKRQELAKQTKENRLRQFKQKRLKQELAKQTKENRLRQFKQKRLKQEVARKQKAQQLKKEQLEQKLANQERQRQQEVARKQKVQQLKKERLKQEVANQERQRQKEEVKELESSHNYIYVTNFVTLYTNNDHSDEEISKLRELLALKGTHISTVALKQCISRAIEKNQYRKFEKQLSHHNAKNSEGIVRYFLDVYGENHTHYLTYLYYFLKQNNNISSQSETTTLVNKTRQVIIIENFEKQLLSQDPNLSAPEYYDINAMGGLEFERFLGELFTHMGYQATITPASGDQGADLTLSKHGTKFVVQAKNYSKPVSNTAIQEVVAAIKFYAAHEGMVVTNNSFTPSAIELAEANHITLIDGKKLQQMVQKYL